MNVVAHGDLQVDTFLPYMRDVVRCETSLRELNLTWRMIEANAKIACPQEARSILPMMTATRVSFERLEQDLVNSLVAERVAHVLDEVGIKASHIVDIIVRNLYERTADVGFLATDQELCSFVAGLGGDRASATERLRAYRSKYTVYNDILLLDTAGNVLAQIDAESPVEGSRDPLLAQTLSSPGFVQIFRPTDLRPGQRAALVYAQRMIGPNGQVVGALCLSFDFEREMQGIFRSRQDGDDRAILLLLDGDNRVIASGDEQWVPVGQKVPVHHGHEARLVMYGGRAHLARTCHAAGYQGYPGPPGWQGQVMIPVDVAFTSQRGQALKALDPAIAQGLLSHARSFCPTLFEIVTAAQAIRRVVWNGQVMTASQRRDLQKLKSILEQVSDTGARTNVLFSESIQDLYDTVLGSTLRRAEFTADLLVDLLDRNLYERSDDCRWWALTPQLRQILAHGQAAAEQATLNAILENIHRLYTVYSRLVVYDAEGRIVAGTQLTLADGHNLLGACIDPQDLSAVLNLKGPQNYHVSAFVGSPLSDGASTYVYHAAIRHPDDEKKVVGGIGIVFDSAREFRAMLREGTAEQPEAAAIFVDRQGRLIGSSSPAHQVGSLPGIPPAMLALRAGESHSQIVVHEGQYMVLGRSANSGYREFKTSDGYREDVLAFVFSPLGAVQQDASWMEQGRDQMILPDPDLSAGEEYATFFLDGQLHALAATQVQQASPGTEIVPVSADRHGHRLGTIALRSQGQVDRYVWVYDLAALVRGSPTPEPAARQVIIVRHGGQDIGLLVDALHGVPEFSAHDVVPMATAQRGTGFVRSLIKANQGSLLIPVLHLDGLAQALGVSTALPLAA